MPRAVVTNYRRLGGLSRNVFSYGSKNQKSKTKVSVGPQFSPRLQGEPFLASSRFWWSLAILDIKFLGLWTHHCNLCLYPHQAFSLGLSVSQISSSL